MATGTSDRSGNSSRGSSRSCHRSHSRRRLNVSPSLLENQQQGSCKISPLKGQTMEDTNVE